ncbi:MAG TPA: hypothetical protein VK480_05765, partial [Solirubrobacterales bacterium]|nr:hypothetical protein [Solirubrobacterales bacterium]
RRLTKQGEGTADGLPQAPKGRTTGKPPSVIKPSDFIEELTHADRPPALLPHHWKDAEKKNEVKETIPSAREAATGTDDFSSLAGGFEFLAPLRVLVHRVDLVAPVAVRDLVSFPDMDDRDRGPDEMVTTEF